MPQGGQLHGVVHDPTGRPAAEVDVVVSGTPLRAVTDTEGRFVLANVPPGRHHLQFEGRLAATDVFTATVPDVEVTMGERTLEPVVLAPAAGLQLVLASGDGQTGVVGRPLDDPLVVTALNQDGHPVPGLLVTFMVTVGNGSLATPQPVLTDAQGRAEAVLTMGTQAGAHQVTVTGPGLAPVTFNVMGQADREHARLIRVSGNNQIGRAGEVLPAPLVVRLEDQFGNPLVEEPLTAALLRGAGELRTTDPVAQASRSWQTALRQQTRESVTMTTNARGEVAFTLLVQSADTNIEVQVSAPKLAVRPVQFFAIVGTVDTPDLPRALAVAGTTVYIADRSGLQLMDVSDPNNPRPLPPIPLEGSEERLTIADTLLYVATASPPRLHILDITNPPMPVLLGSAHLHEDVEKHGINGVEVQGTFAFVLTDARIAASGTIQVVDIRDPAKPLWIGASASLPDRPHDIAVAGTLAYVPAGTAGLLVFDISDPTAPKRLPSVEGTFVTGITVAGDFAYVVETRAEMNYFTILDLRTPAAPQRRGAVQTRRVRQSETRFPIAVAGHFAYLVEFALGLQAIDISNPDAPRLIGRLDTPSVALNIAATDTFIYVTDRIFGLYVIQGPGPTPVDTDGDGVVDYFDAFPTNPAESQDTDSDGLDDATDLDDDNDSFMDTEDPDRTDPRIYPVQLPPAGTTLLTVDAASTALIRERNGTPEAPYRSITEALQAIRQALSARRVLRDTLWTLEVRAGTYAPLTTQESFPLNLLSSLTMRGAGWESTVIDAAWSGNVLSVSDTSQVTIEGFTLRRGANGLLGNRTTGLTLRGNRIAENDSSGIIIGINSDAENTINTITQNMIDSNGRSGLTLFENAVATITNNIIKDNANDGIAIGTNSRATVTNNIVQKNADLGIRVTTDSRAAITANIIEDNADDGVQIFDNSRATVTDNIIRANQSFGIRVTTDSRAAITANIIEGNTDDGIAIFGNSTATVTNNIISENKSVGISVANASTAELVANIITANDSSGLVLRRGAVARISGGVVSQNMGNGVLLREKATATIGLDGAILTLAQNGSSGIFPEIFVDNDGSKAQINSARIMFDRNVRGNIVGRVLDFSDTDLDGLSDEEEAELGTNPNHPDTDDDTFSDGVEVASGSDPLAPGSTPTMILYGVTHTGTAGLSTFYVLDPITDRDIRVGAIGFQRVSGMEVRADGTAYATEVSLATGKHMLLTIDLGTGAGTEVGPTGVEALKLQTVTDLAFRNADNALYAYFEPGDSVGTLDPATGAATVLGSSGVFCCDNGIAFSPEDILFHANNEALHTLEQSHGTATVVVPLNFPPLADNRPHIHAMDFQPDTGELFALLKDGSAEPFETYLATINPITGEVTIIGRTVEGLDALAWFPVP